MVKRAFIEWNPARKTQRILHPAIEIIEEFTADNYTVTLRQLYYQLVTRGIIPNKLFWYDRLGEMMKNARLSGMVDWDAIEDRGRVPVMPPDWAGPASVMRAAVQNYRLDRWEGQAYHVEVWSEKDALSGILEGVCYRYHVRLLANRGYSSVTALYDASLRFDEAADVGKEPVVIYLGDHDPSGIDMVRDIDDRLELMSDSATTTIERVALNLPQVKIFSLPPNPTKITDSRAKEYIELYGYESWEVDALTPGVIEDLVSDAIVRHLDLDAYEAVIDQEEADKEALREAAETLRGS